jgi:putative CocE/NonD family hydrolase
MEHHAIRRQRSLVRTLLSLLFTLLTLPGLAWAEDPPRKPAETKSAPGLPASLSGFEDEGAFSVYRNEERLVTMTCKWQKDGTFDSTSVLALAGQKVTQKLHITPDKDGRWTKMTFDTPLGPSVFERTQDGAQHTQKKTTSINLKPDTRLFENFSPALLSQAVRHYDQTKGGKQKAPVLILNGGIILDFTLERKDRVERSIGGKDVKFTRYAYSIAGTDLILWIEESGKLDFAEVPAQHVVYVRDGFELLRRAPESDPLLSSAKYTVSVKRNVEVPMRDGTPLKTDVYLPQTEARFPLILIRTPYKKDVEELKANYYARRGYAVAVQNCRGRFGSSGTWEPFIHEAKDGHDAIEWLAKQPWCNGKVGMIGGSYLGWVQWWAARERPPHLVTIIPNVSPPDPFYNLPYEYGVFFLQPAIWWAEVLDKEATADISGAAMSSIMEKKYQKLLRDLPVIDLDKKVLGRENPFWRKWIAHPVNDDYWAQANFLDSLKDVRLPVFHQSGWFDGDGIGSKLNYLRMAACGHPNQKLILGPWGHTDEAITGRMGDHDFGPDAILDLERAYLRWFDYWLKGIDNGIIREPLVRIFVMGSNQWLEGKTYPLPETRFEKWYLSGSGHANTSKGDGRFSAELPPADAPADHYTYDPGDPTPRPDFYEEPDEPTKVQSVEEKLKAAEAYHLQVTQSRKDILVYTSEPMRQPLTFAGPLSAVLYASSSARDTDWFMRLIEVDKAGKLFPLVEGKIRARFRRSTQTPELLEPNKVYEYTLDLWQTGITIPSGHRLRVEVASASFPLFSRNLNTGGHNEIETRYVKADQAIYHNQQYPSHVLLPVIDLKAASRPTAKTP